MSWGYIGAAAIAAVGGIISSSNNKKAAKKGAAGADNTAQVLEEAQLRLEERMLPYIQSGNAADYYINGLLGLPVGAAPGSAPTSGPGSGAPLLSDAQLRAAFPDLAATWDSWERAGSSKTNGHHQLYGAGAEGFRNYVANTKGIDSIYAATTPQDQQSQQASQQAATDAARASAMAAYENSPWAIFARESAEKAREDATESFMSTAGARASVVSGRTAGGLYDISQDAEDERFRAGFLEGWYPSITGVSTRGYNASVGVGDSSLQTAAQIGAAGERAAAARANGQRASDDALATGINSALYYAGQAWDEWRNPPQSPPPPPAKKSTTSSKYYGG